MVDASTTIPAPIVVQAWDAKVILPIIGDPVRWRLLLALARNGPQTGAKLKDMVGQKRDNTIKHLIMMRKAGLVLAATDPNDARRQIYQLSPAVTIVKTESGSAMHFGVCILPF